MHAVRNALLSMPRNAKRLLVMLLDATLCLLAVWVVLALRLESVDVPQVALVKGGALAVTLALPLFTQAGLYRVIFRYSSWNDMGGLAKAMAVYGLLYASVISAVGVPGVPRSVGVSQPLLLMLLVGLSRLLARQFLGLNLLTLREPADRTRVLIYGAGSAGRQLAAAVGRSVKHQLLGFLDDDAQLQGQTLDRVPVYNPAQMTQVLQATRAQEVLLALPSVKRQRMGEILAALKQHPVHVRTLPSVDDLNHGQVTLNDVREVQIEDLLGRDPVPPDEALMQRNVRGKVVLVTGAGGSIGSELCRQILKYQPKTLVLLELSEFALYQIHQELGGADGQVVPLLASVLDERRMQEIMQVWRPNTVYHAAAYKHVPLVESNPFEGIRNNVWGTWVCARQAAAAGVQSFVLISTDKAVRPTSVMGASKRLAEMVLQAMAMQAGAHTRFTMVRFGNVLGSSGSVVPLFRRQIAQGGPITLTHPDITRYFMTIPEASQLVMQAGAMAQGAEVFVLDMGDPVRIADLARRMVELSGRKLRDAENPDGDIELQVTGLRPGEKLYEELLIGDGATPTGHPRILKAQEDYVPWPELGALLLDLERAMVEQDLAAVWALLQRLVSGYLPEGAEPPAEPVEPTKGGQEALEQRAFSAALLIT